MRGVHTRQQNGGDDTVFQYEYVAEKTEYERYDKGKNTEYDGFPPDCPKILHIHFQSRQEHDVVEAYLSEQGKTAVTSQDIESMFSDEDSR